MAIVILPTLVISFALGYVFRDTEFPVPDLGAFLADNEPKSVLTLAMENYAIWGSVFSLAHFVLYVKPQRSLFHPFKLNPNYPPTSLILREIGRSVRGVAICTFYAALVNKLHGFGHLPTNWSPSFLVNDDSPVPVTVLFTGIALMYMWADFHFYWTHRLLHTQMLYKTVHKVHHQSFNPDPFSGLSMHWVESAIYFSSAPIMAVLTPLWMFRALSIGLLIFPLEGHWGFGDWNKEGAVNHYIHHSKFNWNYGSSPLWDHIMGTNFVGGERDRDTDRERVAKEQAEMVDCRIGNEFKGHTTLKKLS